MIRTFATVFVLCIVVWAPSLAQDGPPAGKGDYEDFVALFEEFREYRSPAAWNANFNNPDAPNHGLVDYGKPAINARLKKLNALRERLEDMNVAAWYLERQAEWLAVRAQFNAEEFRLNVSRPWARDPGFYVDQLQRFAFTNLPVEGEQQEKLRRELAATPHIVEAAMKTLDGVAADYAALALHNLSNSDGVGHGHPYRETPPAGVIGWYEDLLERARSLQPELLADVETALESVHRYNDWLTSSRAKFSAQAGVGRERYDWYLKHAKLLPWTGDELILLGDREWERLTAWYALARHKNRRLPELEPSSSAEDYQVRLDEVDANIRAFLMDQEILTIPDYVGTLSTNAPYIERKSGRNFWEEVQFRDPHPDHLHAVIPGHRFDGLVERNNDHPVRRRVSDGVRAEGWGVYLEEAMMEAGVIDDRPRVKELIHLFGIFRAARVPADVKMQRNEMTVDEAVEFMRKGTPYLDIDVARVDAEIYLRRPPGYGVGYTIGHLQMRALLAERRRQLGEDFVLKEFHDLFLSRGRLPISLLRWEMTGHDDEVREFWNREPIPKR